MDILYSSALHERLAPPKSLPNNTLIVDLSESHQHMTSVWPHAGRAATKSLRRLASCCSRLADSRAKSSQRIQSDICKQSKFKFPLPESVIGVRSNLRAADYDSALATLTSDVRYQLHLLLYRQVQSIWLLVSTMVCILVPALVSNLEFAALVSAFFAWLILQLIGAAVSSRFRTKLDEMLEKSVAQVNAFFLDHKLMLGVINVGGLLSNSKLMVPMLYFDTSHCREQIESILGIDSQKDADSNTDKLLDYSKLGLPPMEPNTMAFAQSLAKKLILRYSQRWISQFDKRKLMFTDDHTKPRHLSTGKCLCQFIEEHFKNKRRVGQEVTEKVTKINILDTEATPPVIYSPKMRDFPIDQVTTLSGLISANEKAEFVSVDMDTLAKTSSPLPTLYYNDGLGANCKNVSATSELQVADLDLGQEVIGRREDLIQKLRLLLEIRKDDLQGIDSSFFSRLLYEMPQTFQVPSVEETKVQQVEPQGQVDLKSKSYGGKKFFSQAEGLFFFSTSESKAKRNQQDANANHILEIC